MNRKYQELCQILTSSLQSVYNSEKIINLANFIYKSEYFKNLISNDLVSLESELLLIVQDLKSGRPIQYALGESYFMNLILYVDERVLIPRPETEELVHRCLADNKLMDSAKILEVGTGSGAIAIQMYKSRANWIITALDNSMEALEVAEMNALRYQSKINFRQIDFLNCSHIDSSKFDIIISNPPYISSIELGLLSKEVIDFEPHSALFAEGRDPDIFYKKIAEFGHNNLSSKGVVYCELNEFRAKEIFEIFRNQHYGIIEIHKDLQGKDRILKASF
ncbi:MAG: peptide chain release factor N(5)-glutamine methyltransferase [Saprospiraceae bacterium]